jgi:hypothetical protein
MQQQNSRSYKDATTKLTRPLMDRKYEKDWKKKLKQKIKIYIYYSISNISAQKWDDEDFTQNIHSGYFFRKKKHSRATLDM